MSEKKEHSGDQTRADAEPKGRLLAIDLGRKRCGVAVSDELRMTARPLPPIERTSWKKLTAALAEIVRSFDVRGLVIGLPLRADGTEGEEAQEARSAARKLELQFSIPVELQDERLTSKAAEESLRARGVSSQELIRHVDGEAARIILLDYLARQDARSAQHKNDGVQKCDA